MRCCPRPQTLCCHYVTKPSTHKKCQSYVTNQLLACPYLPLPPLSKTSKPLLQPPSPSIRPQVSTPTLKDVFPGFLSILATKKGDNEIGVTPYPCLYRPEPCPNGRAAAVPALLGRHESFCQRADCEVFSKETRQ